MRVHFLRHGESVSNAHPTAASVPAPEGDRLTERGHEQARAAARRLRDLRPDALVSSPMRRARETAEPLAAELGLPVEIDPDVHEIREASDFGTLSPEEQKLRRWSEWMTEHADDPDWAPPGAESFNAVVDRVRRVKARFESRDPGSAPLVVSHGIFLRFFLVHSLLGDAFGPGDARRLWHLRTANCGLSTFEHGERHHPADPDLDGWTCARWMA